MAPAGRTEVPPSHAPILASRALAHVATIGPRGEPQSHPVWFGWDGQRLAFSTTKARQKYRNLRRDPRISATITDPERPERYLELRGVAQISDDPDRAYINEMSLRYRGQQFPPSPGEERVVVSFVPTHVTGQ
ncbi:MAG TPA: PPOX class F420-dependent oxidoreductase [Actinomycetota bacterium]|nr:PPOX class F420-dependent oxidoreductase [Actinomycetota bacterium]